MNSKIFFGLLLVCSISSMVKGIGWPKGNFGLPMTTSGCPYGSWGTGSRVHDTEDTQNQNSWSSYNHLAGSKSSGSIEQKFCMKSNSYGGSWPSGTYCIYKYGSTCPTGFYTGQAIWDDEDNANYNRVSGSVPRGVYGKDTLIYYCCRHDSWVYSYISLPTYRSFYLLKSPYSNTCQRVSGMSVREEWIFWDCEDDNGNPNVRIHYCYYY